MNKKVFVTFYVLCMLALCGSCSQNKTDLQKYACNTWRIATGGMTGTNYSTGAMIALMVNERSGGMKAFAEASSGATENIRLLQEHEVEIGYSNSTTAVEAGTADPQNRKVIIEGVKSIGSVMSQHIHVIANTSSGIESVNDIRGKSVSVGAMGSGIEVVTENFLSIFGIAKDEYTHIYGSTGEAFEQVVAGDSDCYIAITAIGGASVSECLKNETVKLVPIDSEMIDKIVSERVEYSKDVIPGGTYSCTEDDYETLMAPVLLLVREDIDEDSVYEFTKLLFENHDYLVEQTVLLKPAIPQNAVAGNPIELHKGAERYLREIGVIY